MKNILRILAVIIIIVIPSSPVLAAEFQEVTITATPVTTGGIANFTITYVNDYQLDLAWERTGDAANVMVRVKYGEYPADRDDGHLVYYGDALAYSDTGINLEETASTIYYRAWARDGEDVWYEQPEEGFWESVGMTIAALAFIAVGLTVAMFHTKQSMLGFPCVIFWAVLGGYTYTLSSTPWGDWQFLLSMGCLMGMVPFCAIAAYGLRTKKEEAEVGDLPIDETREDLLAPNIDVSQEGNSVSRKVRALRERATKRRLLGIRRRIRL